MAIIKHLVDAYYIILITVWLILICAQGRALVRLRRAFKKDR